MKKSIVNKLSNSSWNLDQSFQIYFTSKTTDLNVDGQEIKEIYDFIFARAKDRALALQVIAVDHADINEKHYQNIVIEWEVGFV